MSQSKGLAKVIPLVICQVCHKKIKSSESFTKWEESVYCEPCFELYVELLEGAELAVNLRERD